MSFTKNCSACQTVFTTESKVRRRCDSCKIVRVPRPPEQTQASWVRKYTKAVQKRHALINSLGHGCEECGYNTCFDALEFHHLDPNVKEFTLGSKAFIKNISLVMDEVQKCKLLCCNCHRKAHAVEHTNKQIYSSANVKAVITWRRNLKLRAIAYKGGKCNCCTRVYEPYMFDFHHVDAENKDFSVGVDGSTRSWERVKKELDKCILLCANCHREEHARLRCGSSVG